MVTNGTIARCQIAVLQVVSKVLYEANATYAPRFLETNTRHIGVCIVCGAMFSLSAPIQGTYKSVKTDELVPE